jgi:hypothetical protein
MRQKDVLQAIPVIQQTIQKLGQLHDECAIAAFLEAEGVSGSRLTPYDCALANFLQRRTSVPLRVSSEWTAIGTTVMRHPYCVQLFVVRFDKGDFPGLDIDLIERGPAAELMVHSDSLAL